jgi:hypothetical protein
MTHSSPASKAEGIQAEPSSASPSAAPPASRPPSFVKLAMRNMVRKRGKSLYHFALTLVGLLSVLVGLAYLTR